ININTDCYTTATVQKLYITSCLEKILYTQIQPYIKKRNCTLNNFTNILLLLKYLFGNPDRACTAWNKLYYLQ
ncbi:hypothetical protein BO82DRAFT_283332, partial [Aspergillus uvarum CBS 121591]